MDAVSALGAATTDLAAAHPHSGWMGIWATLAIATCLVPVAPAIASINGWRTRGDTNPPIYPHDLSPIALLQM